MFLTLSELLFERKPKFVFYIQFNSQGHIGTGLELTNEEI